MRLLLIVSLAFIFILQLHTVYDWFYWPEVFVACLGFLSYFMPQTLILLGFALPVVTYFEYGTLSLFILSFNFGLYLRKTPRRSIENIGFLILLPLFISLIICLVQEVDPYLYRNIIAFDGFLPLINYIKQTNPIWYKAVFHFATYINVLLLISLLPEGVLEKPEFVKALSCGVIFSCIVGFAQLLEIHPIFSLNRDVFWLYVKRFEGTFTDPNALGVMSALLVPYFYYTRDKGLIVKVAGIVLACFCVFSETRTFWLAMITWFVLENYKYPKRLALLLAPVLLIVPKINTFLQSQPLLDRLDRLFHTLNIETFVDSLYSRLLMGEIALRMWKTAPILGVGLERFYVSQESIAKSSGLDLGEWRDNANNFYLQIASEQGLFGLILFFCLMFFLILNARKQKSIISNKLLIILSVILITGPHLYFEEVKYFVAVLLAGVISERQILNKYIKASIVFTAAASLLINLPHTKSMLGFWPIENSQDGKVAWTGYKAKLKLCNVAEGQIINYRTFNLPMSVRILESEIVIPNIEWQNLVLNKTDKLDLVFSPSRVWKPGDHDQRNLGILLKIPENLCN